MKCFCHRLFSALPGLLATLIWSTVPAAPAAEPALGKLPPGTPLLKGDPLNGLNWRTFKDARWKAEVVSVTGQPFKVIVRAETLQRPAHPYEVQLRFPTSAAVRAGDSVLAHFFARTVAASGETGEATTTVVFEQAGAPFTKWLNRPVSVGRDWKEFHLPFRAGMNRGPGEAQLNFQLGFAPQTIEIGGIELLNFGSQVKLADLPATREGYRGQELDAPWRREAAARIDRVRKGDLKVAVVDASGKPVAGATVGVHMTRHAFGFGSAVVARTIADDDSPDGRKYRDTIARYFNKVVFENDLKWPQWERQSSRPTTLKAARWLNEHGIAIRGHCLVWPAWRNLPRDLERLKDDPAALRRRVAEHVTGEVTDLRGQLVEWDVINEPYTNHQLMDLLGQDVMVEWFKLARQADPNPRLFINDYAILSASGKDSAHQDHYERTIRYLLDQGAPLGGIGLQSHFGHDLTPPDRLMQILDRFARLGLPLEVTEHDIDTSDEQLQADYTRDFLTVLFSHPSVNAILTWGFWEGRHWRPNGAYFLRDWSLRPAGQVWLDLVMKQWWTKAEGATDAGGQYGVRAFLGDYDIKVSHAGKSADVRCSLTQEGKVVTVRLP